MGKPMKKSPDPFVSFTAEITGRQLLLFVHGRVIVDVTE